MSGLLDIGPLTETLVFVRGKKNMELTVHGITAEGLFYLMQKFPEIKLLMERRANEITPDRMMTMAAPTIAFTIGCGLVDADEMSEIDWQSAVTEQAKLARKLNVSDQLRLITVIFNVTFSEGVGPFVEQLVSLMGTSSQRVETPKEDEEPDTKSQGTLSAALVGDVPKKLRGVRPPANSQRGLNS